MKITIFGSGYVGLVTSACFSEVGHEVCCIDIDQNKVKKLKQGKIDIYEPELREMVLRNQKKQRLEFTSNLKQAVNFSSLIFICVGTPESTEGSADLTSVFNVVDSIAKEIKENKVIVIKSTVPPGTGLEIQSLFEHKLKNKNLSVQIASNPEFLREGRAINDFMEPDRVIIGVEQKSVKNKLLDLYSLLISDDKIIFMDMLSAELTKYASNAMLATKISFINEIANISDFLGADIDLVRKGMGNDKRIGFSFMNPGSGYGGSCFPKDVKALISKAQTLGYNPRLLRATDLVNRAQKKIIFSKIVKIFGDNLSGLKFAVWGLSFKPETDDIRESPSIELIKSLNKAGAAVAAYDPKAINQFKQAMPKNQPLLTYMESKDLCVEGADALVVMTEWSEFQISDFSFIKSALKTPIIFDARNFLEEETLRSLGFRYFGIGRGRNAQ